jgi:putative two-component system response regulator
LGISAAAMDKPKNVLLVEDNELCARFFKTILEGAFGCVVHWAKDGPSALNHLQAHKPDLIQMDIQLPFLSGWETIRMISAKPELDDIPICVVTACGLMFPELIGAERERAAEEMTKPVMLADYVHMIARQLFQVGREEAERIGTLLRATWAAQQQTLH